MAKTTPVVQRSYCFEPEACAQAVAALLDFAKQKGPPPDKSGPDDAKERSEDDSRDKLSISEKA